MQRSSTKPSAIFLGYIFDVIAPMVAFFVLDRLGMPPFWSLVVGSAIALGSTAVNSVRHRRLDRVGVLVLIEIAASIVILVKVNDPRLLLARPVLYTAVAGIYLLATSFRGKPLTYDGSFQIGTKGDPLRAAAFERAWERVPRFRQILRISSMGWALACLVDAALRVAVVYEVPLKRAMCLSNLPHLVAIAVLMGFSAFMGRNLRRIVEGELVMMQEEREVAYRPKRDLRRASVVSDSR